MNITVFNNVANIRIMITKLQGLPSTLPFGITGLVYHYISIEKTNITDSDINVVNMEFAVNKTWLTTNNVASTNVTLFRWFNEKWNDLGATKANESTQEVFYNVNSPGLSVFAIGTKGPVTQTPPPSTTCTESWTCTDWSTCINNTRTRTCTDSNSCGTTASKPAVSEACEPGTAEQQGLVASKAFSILPHVFIIVAVIAVCILIFLRRQTITTFLRNLKKERIQEVYQKPKEEEHKDKKKLKVETS